MKLTDKVHLFRIDFEIPISPGKTLPRFVNVIMIFGGHSAAPWLFREQKNSPDFDV